jgi:hypothetical protein
MASVIHSENVDQVSASAEVKLGELRPEDLNPPSAAENVSTPAQLPTLESLREIAMNRRKEVLDKQKAALESRRLALEARRAAVEMKCSSVVVASVSQTEESKEVAISTPSEEAKEVVTSVTQTEESKEVAISTEVSQTEESKEVAISTEVSQTEETKTTDRFAQIEKLKAKMMQHRIDAQNFRLARNSNTLPTFSREEASHHIIPKADVQIKNESTAQRQNHVRTPFRVGMELPLRDTSRMTPIGAAKVAVQAQIRVGPQGHSQTSSALDQGRSVNLSMFPNRKRVFEATSAKRLSRQNIRFGARDTTFVARAQTSSVQTLSDHAQRLNESVSGVQVTQTKASSRAVQPQTTEDRKTAMEARKMAMEVRKTVMNTKIQSQQLEGGLRAAPQAEVETAVASLQAQATVRTLSRADAIAALQARRALHSRTEQPKV